MRNTILIFTACLIGILSCKKDNENEAPDSQIDSVRIDVNVLTITDQNGSFTEYKYTESEIISCEIDSRLYKFEYDSLDQLKERLWFDDDVLTRRDEYVYGTSNEIISINVYLIRDSAEQLYEEQTCIYSGDKLVKIDASQPITFEYENANVLKYGCVGEQGEWDGNGMWLETEYEYNDKKNILSHINMPPLETEYISENLIESKTVTRKQISGTDSSIMYSFHIYESTFEFDSNGNPVVEYRRNIGLSTDTIRYSYTSEIHWEIISENP